MFQVFCTYIFAVKNHLMFLMHRNKLYKGQRCSYYISLLPNLNRLWLLYVLLRYFVHILCSQKWSSCILRDQLMFLMHSNKLYKDQRCCFDVFLWPNSNRLRLLYVFLSSNKLYKWQRCCYDVSFAAKLK